MQHLRREYGSEYHWTTGYTRTETPSPWASAGVLYGSGRGAMLAAIGAGRGVGRFWIPAYFCQEVVRSLIAAGVEVAIHDDGPLDPPAQRLAAAPVSPGDAILWVNYLGLRGKAPLHVLDREAVTVIEDHTHDPWGAAAFDSEADWCIASLRKTLPLPDGAVLWSPVGHVLPLSSPPSPALTQASLAKLAAMALKAAYLDGQIDCKRVYRDLEHQGEEGISSAQPSGITGWSRELLSAFPVREWRSARGRNFRVFSEAMEGVGWARVLQPEGQVADTTPYQAAVRLDHRARRDALRLQLRQECIYTAILWPLDDACLGIPWPDKTALSERILCVCCDHRYDAEDMAHIAARIRDLGERIQRLPSGSLTMRTGQER